MNQFLELMKIFKANPKLEEAFFADLDKHFQAWKESNLPEEALTEIAEERFLALDAEEEGTWRTRPPLL